MDTPTSGVEGIKIEGCGRSVMAKTVWFCVTCLYCPCEGFLNTTKVEEEDTLRNYFKKTRLDVKNFSFSTRVVDKLNSLTDTCVNCITVNNFKDYILILKELEPETCTIEYYHV